MASLSTVFGVPGAWARGVGLCAGGVALAAAFTGVGVSRAVARQPTVTESVVAAATPAEPVSERPDGSSAALMARLQGSRVEDLSQRTESTSTFANPDGTWTTEDHGAPIRVEQDGEWVDVDLSLVEQTDGAWVPKASPVNVVVDGGGSNEAGKVTFDDGSSVAVTWPGGALPTPTVEGGVATYKVSDTSDLLVTMTNTGLDAWLRLNEKPADTDQSFTFGLKADGVDVDQHGAGLVFKDEDGEQVGVTSQLVAWDDQTNAADDRENVVPLDAELTEVTAKGDVTESELDLTPPAGFLDDPDTQYPVIIDPNITAGRGNDTWVASGVTTPQISNIQLVVGNSTVSANTEARSYLKWESDKYAGKTIVSATMKLYEFEAGSCSPRQTNVHPLGQAFGSSTVWTNRPSVLTDTGGSTSFTTNVGGEGCTAPNGWVSIDITTMVALWAAGTVTNNGLVLNVPTANKDDHSYVKRFCSMTLNAAETTCQTGERRPILSVTYNSAPTISSLPTFASGSPAETTSARPRVKASASDPEGQRVQVSIQVHTSTAGTAATLKASCASTLAVPEPAGSECTLASDLQSGTYYARAKATDELGFASAWSPWSTIHVRAPLVSGALPPRSLSAGTLAALTTALAVALKPSAEPVINLSAVGNSAAFAQASVNAAARNELAVSAVSIVPSELLDQLEPLDATKLRLIGPEAAFPESVRTYLDSYYTVDYSYVSDNSFDWSLASNPGLVENIVVGNIGIANSVAVATEMAMTESASLVILDGTESDLSLTAMLDSPDNRHITLVGGEATLTVAPTSIPEDQALRVSTLDTVDLASAELTSIASAIGNGRSIYKLIAINGSDPISVAVGSRLAQFVGGVAASQASIDKHVQLLAQRPRAVATVGLGASEADATLLESRWQGGSPIPSWRVTDVNVAATSFSVTHTGYIGATKYEAYDAEGALLGSSTTTTIPINGPADAVAIVAKNSGGTILGTLQFKVNAYDTAADRSEVVVGSTATAVNSLKFLGPANLPRQISRTKIPVDGTEVAPEDVSRPISISCGSEYTDAAQDPAFQYQYEVLVMGTDPRACESSGAATGGGTQLLGGVTFPATVMPSFAPTAVLESATGASDGGVRASRTLAGSATSAGPSLASGLGERTVTPFAMGDDWTPIMFRYRAWIPESYAWAPGFTGQLTRPFIYFAGDGRGSSPGYGTHRYQQDVTVYFGTAHHIDYTEFMGETIKYACKKLEAKDCVEMSRARASYDQLDLRSPTSNATSATFALTDAAKNPLSSIAFPIDADIGFRLRPGGTNIRGAHDAMPGHEIWYKAQDWGEWERAYVSTAHLPACLLQQIAPACTIKLNVNI